MLGCEVGSDMGLCGGVGGGEVERDGETAGLSIKDMTASRHPQCVAYRIEACYLDAGFNGDLSEQGDLLKAVFLHCQVHTLTALPHQPCHEYHCFRSIWLA